MKSKVSFSWATSVATVAAIALMLAPIYSRLNEIDNHLKDLLQRVTTLETKVDWLMDRVIPEGGRPVDFDPWNGDIRRVLPNLANGYQPVDARIAESEYFQSQDDIYYTNTGEEVIARRLRDGDWHVTKQSGEVQILEPAEFHWFYLRVKSPFVS